MTNIWINSGYFALMNYSSSENTQTV